MNHEILIKALIENGFSSLLNAFIHEKDKTLFSNLLNANHYILLASKTKYIYDVNTKQFTKLF